MNFFPQLPSICLTPRHAHRSISVMLAINLSIFLNVFANLSELFLAIFHFHPALLPNEAVDVKPQHLIKSA
jgi:hypothetical protein